MVQSPIYDGAGRAGLYSSKARESSHPGPAVMRVGNHLAVACLFFGAAFAAFVSGSLDQRVGNLFFFGLIPAIGFYAGGHAVGQLLVFGVVLCDLCFRYAVHLISGLLSWAGTQGSQTRPGAPAPNGAGRIDSRRHFRSRAVELIFSDRSDEGPCMAQSSDFPMTTNFRSVTCCSRVLRRLVIIGLFLTTFGFGWLGVYDAPPDSQREAAAPTIDAVVERIIGVESYGDPNAKNKRSSATGLGQFLDETWLDMIRAHRPDLAKGRSQDEILELRRDAKVAREITARFTQRNAEMLRKRGLPVTP